MRIKLWSKRPPLPEGERRRNPPGIVARGRSAVRSSEIKGPIQAGPPIIAPKRPKD